MWKLALLLLPALAQAEIRLSPQFVVDRILREGLDSRAIELDAQSAYTAYYNNFGAYDLNFNGSVSYEDSRIISLTGGGNPRDQNTVWSAALAKRAPSGTNFELSFNRTQQRSVYSGTVSSTTRSPYAVYDVGELTITQDLLGNFFGTAERQRNRAAEQLLDSADLQKKEKQEQLVLDALRLFWDSYVARESLREAIAQRDKYEALVREVQNKSHFSISSPGDLPKAKAEFASQVSNVKAAAYTYQTKLDQLLTAMRLEPVDRNISFEFNEELPALPTMVMPGIDGLRSVRVNQTLFDSAELARRATDLSVRWPELKLVGTAGLTGLDSRSGRAFSKMAGGERDRYLVALEVSYKFFSQGNLGALNAVNVTAEQAYNNLLRQKDDLRQQTNTAMANVEYTYAAALSAMEEMKQWEAALKANERSYRQGRLDFSQLIQDYNSYFQSRTDRLRTMGDYHIALHSYAATVDDLVR